MIGPRHLEPPLISIKKQTQITLPAENFMLKLHEIAVCFCLISILKCGVLKCPVLL